MSPDRALRRPVQGTPSMPAWPRHRACCGMPRGQERATQEYYLMDLDIAQVAFRMSCVEPRKAFVPSLTVTDADFGPFLSATRTSHSGKSLGECCRLFA